ncbi:hypothetical protein HDU93_005594 [Gonapodya sp. JEL0774]|nr:hypothetical protein HDU93_005594 [Gonapodya sp. JEL0774]
MAADLRYHPTVTLTDESKFYYTYVNGVPSTDTSRVRQLIKNDAIGFGNAAADGEAPVRFRLKREPVVICLSGVPKVLKKELTALAHKLDIKLESDWTDSCTHLVMQTLKVTYKAVTCLADCRHIVSDAWVRGILAVNEVGFMLPTEAEFLPEIVEESVVSNEINFAPDPRHSEADILRDVNDIEELTLVSAKDGGVGEVENRIIARVAKSLGTRLISAEEIGYAVLFASTAQHTNPSDDILDPLATQRTQKTQKTQQKAQSDAASGDVSGLGRSSGAAVKVEPELAKAESPGGPIISQPVTAYSARKLDDLLDDMMGDEEEPEPAPPADLSQEAPEWIDDPPPMQAPQTLGKRKSRVVDDEDERDVLGKAALSTVNKRARMDVTHRDALGSKVVDALPVGRVAPVREDHEDDENFAKARPNRAKFESMIPAASTVRPQIESVRLDEDDDLDFAVADAKPGSEKSKKGGARAKKLKTVEDEAIQKQAAAFRRERMAKQQEDDEMQVPDGTTTLVKVEFADIVVEPQLTSVSNDGSRGKGKGKVSEQRLNFKRFKKQLLAPFTNGAPNAASETDAGRRHAIPTIPLDELAPYERRGEERVWIRPNNSTKGGKGKGRRAQQADRWGFPVVDENSEEEKDDEWAAAAHATFSRGSGTSRGTTPVVASSEIQDVDEEGATVSGLVTHSKTHSAGTHVIRDSDEDEEQSPLLARHSVVVKKKPRLLEDSDEDAPPPPPRVVGTEKGPSKSRTNTITSKESRATPPPSSKPSVRGRATQAKKANRSQKSQSQFVLPSDDEEDDAMPTFQWRIGARK